MEKKATRVILWRVVYLCILLGIGVVQLYVGVRYESECRQNSVPELEAVQAAKGTACYLTVAGVVTILLAVIHIIHILSHGRGACRRRGVLINSLIGSNTILTLLSLVLYIVVVYSWSQASVAVPEQNANRKEQNANEQNITEQNAPIWQEFCLLVHSRTIALCLIHSMLWTAIVGGINVRVLFHCYSDEQMGDVCNTEMSDTSNTEMSVRSNTQRGIQSNAQCSANIIARRRADINVQIKTQRSCQF